MPSSARLRIFIDLHYADRSAPSGSILLALAAGTQRVRMTSGGERHAFFATRDRHMGARFAPRPHEREIKLEAVWVPQLLRDRG